jgi:hypothetical protein
MRIILQSKLSRASVQEGSALTVTAKFYDDASDPWTLSAPTTIRYRVDDLNSGSEMVGWTTVTPATSASITVSGSENRILQSFSPQEGRMMTVQANAGLSTQYSETYNWFVTDIYGIT